MYKFASHGVVAGAAFETSTWFVDLLLVGVSCLPAGKDLESAEAWKKAH